MLGEGMKLSMANANNARRGLLTLTSTKGGIRAWSMAILLLWGMVTTLAEPSLAEANSLLEDQLAQLKVLALNPAEGQAVIHFGESHLLSEGDVLDFFPDIDLEMTKVHRDRVVLVPTQGRDQWREVWLYRADQNGKSWARVLYSQAEEPPIYHKPLNIRLDLTGEENSKIILKELEPDSSDDADGED